MFLIKDLKILYRGLKHNNYDSGFIKILIINNH